jgi:hypothetical protein
MQGLIGNAGKFVNLWEIMDSFRAFKLAIVFQKLEKYSNKCQAVIDQTEHDAVSYSSTSNALASLPIGASLEVGVTDTLHREICDFLEHEMHPLCDELKFTHTAQTIIPIVRYLNDKNSRINISSLDANLRSVKDAISRDCFKLTFVQVVSSLTDYLNKDSLFGDAVKDCFPSASEDIKNAGNCLAVELPTAAVFHLMCVVEWGLRAFAIDLGLIEVLIGRKNNKTKPIEYAQWEQILNQLSDKIKVKIESIADWSQKQHAQEFYYTAKEEFEAFRHAWRIHVMHAHRSYGLEDAIAVSLCANISETLPPQ